MSDSVGSSVSCLISWLNLHQNFVFSWGLFRSTLAAIYCRVKHFALTFSAAERYINYSFSCRLELGGKKRHLKNCKRSLMDPVLKLFLFSSVDVKILWSFSAVFLGSFVRKCADTGIFMLFSSWIIEAFCAKRQHGTMQSANMSMCSSHVFEMKTLTIKAFQSQVGSYFWL